MQRYANILHPPNAYSYAPYLTLYSLSTKLLPNSCHLPTEATLFQRIKTK
ncbi:hypothetical protein HMPREF9134_00381 [Porphyromonas catoniae F0037]|uniref:Uncharacterized protein n=1 Tax=Porphyromonas catoniae F0037 TaxID=1127696 RepID=L1NGS0_9PORP|nr:hypothetical protein HMPREF9134_00381 [Porphyromonas catoniae F0037]